MSYTLRLRLLRAAGENAGVTGSYTLFSPDMMGCKRFWSAVKARGTGQQTQICKYIVSFL
ncbi:hypothetical protein BTJ39_05290 [Izhakiella australiensis]|uniref:Uncharacterized protein n=1 Tax=Izhakiella australiensis TaxID=1926881 RepID=A0A1S8YRD4_9GAMM|nr:hypothetical protein BTJ39_05290 [Izhakiella australiensis]